MLEITKVNLSQLFVFISYLFTHSFISIIILIQITKKMFKLIKTYVTLILPCSHKKNKCLLTVRV